MKLGKLAQNFLKLLGRVRIEKDLTQQEIILRQKAARNVHMALESRARRLLRLHHSCESQCRCKWN